MDKMKLPELKAEAKKRKIKGFSKMKKAELLEALKPAEKPAPKKESVPKKESSLGNIPFNLVKEFMLEKPQEKYVLEEDQEFYMVAELYHYIDQFEKLRLAVKYNTQSPQKKDKKELFNEYIDYVLKKIRGVIKKVDADFNFLKDEEMMKRINEELENEENEFLKYETQEWWRGWGILVLYAEDGIGDEDYEWIVDGVLKTAKKTIQKRINDELDNWKMVKEERDDDAKDSVKSKVERRGVDVKEEKRIADEKIAEDKRIAEEKVIEDERLRVQAINDEAYGDVVRCVRTFLLSLVGDSKAEYRQKLKNLINIEF